jgi:ribosome-binding protein aMBF1 (putative translation factor)
VAEMPTPASAAAFVGPPSASITASTEVSMVLDSSRNVNLSRLHGMAVDSGQFARCNLPMAETLKTIAARLVRTRQAIGLSAAEICKRIDCKPNRWSQYETGERKITLAVANRLCDEFGLSLDWIYRSDPFRLPHELAAKLRKAA